MLLLALLLLLLLLHYPHRAFRASFPFLLHSDQQDCAIGSPFLSFFLLLLFLPLFLLLVVLPLRLVLEVFMVSAPDSTSQLCPGVPLMASRSLHSEFEFGRGPDFIPGALPPAAPTPAAVLVLAVFVE